MKENTFIVWVGGTEVYEGHDKDLALIIEQEWKDKGYDDVAFDSFWRMGVD